MSFINYNKKEIHCKVVYYGPSLGGKTTNLQWVYKQLQELQKSELFTLPTDTERTLFFDFLPLEVGEINGYNVRFHLYTVPGQVVYEASRRLILKGLDGVIFVADSQKERLEENKRSFEGLKANLERQGYNYKNLPLVMQYNKQDLPNAMSVKDLRLELNQDTFPDFEARAHEGAGVFESLKEVSKQIIASLKSGKVN
ncbi:MAG: GTP-binding protein [Bdellovibrionales bacterium]